MWPALVWIKKLAASQVVDKLREVSGKCLSEYFVGKSNKAHLYLFDY